MHEFRTHTCNDLRKSDIGGVIRLSGWIHSRRDHGGVLFIDLRDNYGITQVVVYPRSGSRTSFPPAQGNASSRSTGKSRFRSEENINPKLPTGEMEVVADSYEILGLCRTLAFQYFSRRRRARRQLG